MMKIYSEGGPSEMPMPDGMGMKSPETTETNPTIDEID